MPMPTRTSTVPVVSPSRWCACPQLGMLAIHWADALPIDIAVVAFASGLGGWLNMVAFLQNNHIHKLLGSSGAAIASTPPSGSSSYCCKERRCVRSHRLR